MFGALCLSCSHSLSPSFLTTRDCDFTSLFHQTNFLLSQSIDHVAFSLHVWFISLNVMTISSFYIVAKNKNSILGPSMHICISSSLHFHVFIDSLISLCRYINTIIMGIHNVLHHTLWHSTTFGLGVWICLILFEVPCFYHNGGTNLQSHP